VWIIYTKNNKPLWKSSDKTVLEKLLKDLKENIGNKFYLKQIEEKNETNN
jgi:hypothetical protein